MATMRIWRTGVDPRRVDEYLAFAAERSLPMFQAHDGFLGVIFAGRENSHVVVSLWRDAEAADALNNSDTYKETVDAIQEAGFLNGEQTLEILRVTDMYLQEHLLS